MCVPYTCVPRVPYVCVYVPYVQVGNTALGLADPQKTLSAAIAVFLFNVLYEVGVRVGRGALGGVRVLDSQPN